MPDTKLNSASHPILVVAGLVYQGQELLITQRTANDAWGGYWEFPGGKVEAGETEPQALERELWEEIGVRTQTGNLAWELTHDYPTNRVLVRFYYSTILSGSLTCREVQSWQWVKRAELRHFKFLPSNEVLLKKLIDEEI